MSDNLFLIFGLTSLTIILIFIVCAVLMHRRRKMQYATTTTIYGTNGTMYPPVQPASANATVSVISVPLQQVTHITHHYGRHT